MNELVAPQTDDTEARSPLAGMPRGRTRAAVELMVWQGVPLDMAAVQCGLKEKSLRDAFRLPSVKAYYAALLDVLRSGERARNVHRLVAIRDAANNMPAVQAIKALEELDDAAALSRSGMQRAPGMQIVIVQPPAVSQPLPHAAPLELEAQEVPAPQRVR